ncbi:ChaB-like protein [Spodoptera exempta nucleopolyhedrovirus]|uniref:ChaB-like protein n=1 Tax=Spodoptera exempta nucleopolyhedrovirus TaxID=1242863 RepID=A0A410S7S8_9ABAC|nr:ChaB-like protein [Spodoptera exempta nucleopolyhedrovirus]QAT90385.1 ChaB-like protein [Spodoptera exempta nucleopolyhedrovirus]
MYYNISQLPVNTRVLPYQGKRIYMKFFNRAYENYKSDVTASKIAWQAVKRKYKKVGENWVPRKDANQYDTTSTDDDTTTTTTNTSTDDDERD